MLVEFTGIDNLPVIVNFAEIAGIVQKKKYTYIYLNSGIELKVKESAAEIMSEVSNASAESLLMEAMANGTVAQPQ